MAFSLFFLIRILRSISLCFFVLTNNCSGIDVATGVVKEDSSVFEPDEDTGESLSVAARRCCFAFGKG